MKYQENIQEMLSLEPDYMGFIFYRNSKRYVDSLDAEWIHKLSGTKKTGVFVDAEPGKIRDRITRFGLQAVQLHGNEGPETCEAVRDTGVETIKAFGIADGFNWDSLTDYIDAVDYFLFDTKTAGYGGSGQTFDWELLTGYTHDKPYFLSGGLEPDNLHRALEIDDDRLYALDLNSKFETQPALKNRILLEKAFQTIRHE